MIFTGEKASARYRSTGANTDVITEYGYTPVWNFSDALSFSTLTRCSAGAASSFTQVRRSMGSVT
ncbi:MAG: hypothetical protein IPN17_27755 [Deltaproteobacteria bacterium]|nr:hypothetical protein [Deltaproteobacteria bacterium]